MTSPKWKTGEEADRRPLAGRSIAVFGSSEPEAGSQAYEEARRLGELLATSGARVVNGGYSGVMEAASRGAQEVGGSVTGVVCELFSDRSPNRFLTEVVPGRDLFDRTRLLFDLSEGFIVLPGKSGTIAELALLWALDRARLLKKKPIILCGSMWPALIEAIERAGALEPEQRRATRLCSNVEEAVSGMAQWLQELD